MEENGKMPLSFKQEKLNEDIALFESMEGWKKLSRRQQRMIIASIYIQSRAERTIEMTNAQNKSTEHVMQWYCHAAVWNLEKEQSLLDDGPPLDSIEEEFFAGEYETPESLQAITQAIRKVGFPAVVHIAQELPPLTLLQRHTFLALGVQADGDIIVWEKEWDRTESDPAKLPYRRNSLSRIYKEYKDVPYWGVRQLAASNKKNI